MKNMYKANRQRLTDIPYAHNPTDVNKNLFSLKTFQQQKHAAKTWKKYAVEKTATAKIRNIALKYFNLKSATIIQYTIKGRFMSR